MKNDKGQILIEILVAVTIFAFLAVSIYSLIGMSRKTSRMSIQKMQAQNLVQEGIEKVRSIRDYNLKNGLEYDANTTPGIPAMNRGAYIVESDPLNNNIFQLLSDSTGSGKDLGNGFTRYIEIENDVGVLTVTVTVSWNNDASQEKAVTYLTNWKAP